MGRLVEPFMTYLDANGVPLANGLLQFNESGDASTAKATYSDAALTTSNANPIVLDSAGRAGVDVFGSGAYRMIVKNSSGVTQETFDDLRPAVETRLMANVKDYGAQGDNSTDDTTAVNSAIAALTAANGGTLYFPAGTYLLTDLTAFTNVQNVIIKGDGRFATFLKYASNLTADLFDFTSASGSFQRFELRDLTIDGNSNTGVAVSIKRANKATIENVEFKDVDDYCINAYEWWDSAVINVKFQDCGNFAGSKANVRLRNTDATDSTTSCNNLGFYDVQVENHLFRAFDIQDSSRKISFYRLKCHHDPITTPVVNHVVIDRANASGGAPLGISFVGCHFARCGNSALVLTNTGGTAANGPLGVSVIGGSIKNYDEYGVKVIASGGLTVSGVYVESTGGNAAFYCYEGCNNVWIDTDTCMIDDAVPFHYDGASYTTSPNTVAEIQSGAITAFSPYMVVDVEGLAASTDDLDTINGGSYGKSVSIRASNASRTIVVKDATDNIRCPSAGDFSLDNQKDVIALRYDAQITAWLTVSASSNGT